MRKKIYRFTIFILCLLGAFAYHNKYAWEVPYKLRKVYITIPDLPDEFDGLTIGHLSDIHCGNYRKRENLEEGITLLRQQKPDIIFITGDVIERHLEEITPYHDLLSSLTAKEGVFSSLGNHEYGPTHLHKARDPKHIAAIKEAHKKLGWKLLLNENHIITRGNAKLAIIGVENYSTGLFPSYGNLKQAMKGTEKAQVRLLLSHDPSHWDAEVTKTKPTIHVTFSGHTHGSQIKITRGHGNPFHYYRQYHGLYKNGQCYIYVTSGIGNSKKFGRRFKKREVVLIILQKK